MHNILNICLEIVDNMDLRLSSGVNVVIFAHLVNCLKSLKCTFSLSPGPQFAEEPAPAPMPTPSFGDYRQYQWEDSPTSYPTRPFSNSLLKLQRRNEDVKKHHTWNNSNCTQLYGPCLRSEGQKYIFIFPSFRSHVQICLLPFSALSCASVSP